MTLSRARAVLEKLSSADWDEVNFYGAGFNKLSDGMKQRVADESKAICLHRQLFDVVEWAASTIPDMRCFCGIADCDACDGAMRLKALETRLAEVLE